MNIGTRILLMNDTGDPVPGGETDVNPRGGVFGEQGYGGGIFDGSLNISGLGESDLGATQPGMPADAAVYYKTYYAAPGASVGPIPSGYFYSQLYQYGSTGWKMMRTKGPYTDAWSFPAGSHGTPEPNNPPWYYEIIWYWTKEGTWRRYVQAYSWINEGEWQSALSGLGADEMSSQEIDCAALCSVLMLAPAPVGGPIATALCAARCKDMTATKTCFLPSVCISVASKFPNLISPDIVQSYCGLPADAQKAMEMQCNALAAAIEAKQQLPPPPAPAPAPGPTPPPPVPEEEIPQPPKAAGMSAGTIAVFAGAALGLGYLLFRKKKR